MAETVYTLCFLSSLICAIMLYRGFHSTRLPLLFWSATCFLFLAVANILLIVDLVFYPGMDLAAWRSGLSLIGLLVLLYGLIFKSD